MTFLFPFTGTVINCHLPDDCFSEGEEYIATCTRSLDLTVLSKIKVSSVDGTATGYICNIVRVLHCFVAAKMVTCLCLQYLVAQKQKLFSLAIVI